MTIPDSSIKKYQQPPAALLLVTPSCPHCASIKVILNKLLNEGLLAQVDIVDVSQQPDVAQNYAVKSVPWLKIGPVILRGAQSESVVRQWLSELNPSQPATDLFAHLLQTDQLEQVLGLVQQNPSMLSDFIPLVADQEQDLKIRLGVSAVIEHYEGDPILLQLIPSLVKLVHHEHARVRADVAHYLGLTHHPDAITALKQLSVDKDREVREIAMDGLPN